MTDEEIYFLISCPKRISKPPKKEDEIDRGHRKNSLLMQTEDGVHNFSLHFRQNTTFEENFSIILRYHPNEEKSFILARFNGPHGPHRSFEHHATPHIHLAIAENIESGLDDPCYIEVTTDYASYHEAKRYIIKRCNIIGGKQYIAPPKQQNIFQ